jgi:hypothetical protein
MSTAAPLQAASAKPAFSSRSLGGKLLQRKCACGSSKSPLGETCDECQSRALQRKLAIGASNDPMEQEADRVADQVMATSTHSAVSGTPPRIQRFAGQLSGPMHATPASVDQALASPGRPLEPALRQNMEQRFGHDFSRVRVHTDETAERSACGDGCPSYQSNSTDLKISQPTDAAEIEADQIADRVMQIPAGRAAHATYSGNLDNTIHRKCDVCENEDEMVVQRKALPSAGRLPSNSPNHVQTAINSGGRPLDQETRNFFEPRIGYDLSSVRIHTGPSAHESARSIDAKAYTFGSHIVFGHGEYRPDSEGGKHLLAHELAHTTQSSPGAHRVIHRRGGGGGAVTARPAPPLPNYWQIQGSPGTAADQANLNRLGRGSAVVGIDVAGGSVDLKKTCTDQGSSTDWVGCTALKGSQANFRWMQGIKIREAERPYVDLRRGGFASDAFVIEYQVTQAFRGSYSSYTYPQRYFHIIDAMEHDFVLSTSYVGDQILYMLYFPELQHSNFNIEHATKSDPEFLRDTAIIRVNFVPDPQSVPERLAALGGILNRRAAKIRALLKQLREERLLAEAETATLAHKGKQRRQGACYSKAVSRKGGDDRHNKYAEHVAKEKGFGKVKNELEYTTPEGVSYSFDVYNPAEKSQVWEVKTMHAWAGPDKIAIAPRIVRDKKTKLPNLSERIASLESQRLKGIYVAARCGLAFRYAFDNCEAYRGFREQWLLPPLEYIPYPGETKEVCND